MNPLLLVDSYKVNHFLMYPEGMTKLYSNFTPRKSRIEGIDGVVVFGIQHFILEYLIKKFNEEFFFNQKDENGFPLRTDLTFTKNKVIAEYKRHCPVDTAHIEQLWDLGYLPIEIKALPEGTICPIGVPLLTVTNTHPDFGWLVNYLETLLSCMLWQSITSATLAHHFKKILTHYAIKTTGSTEGVQWQGHDFAMRGLSSPESAILSGMGHLLSFTGTDTIPAIYQLENSYDATGLIGASVPATEHSVMCMGEKEAEVETFKRLLRLYSTGILSVVSDTWDLWKVLTEYLPQIKKEILARDGKLVIRPDSGDPVKIITGYTREEVIFTGDHAMSDKETGADLYQRDQDNGNEVYKGVVELLWDVFGGSVNDLGYKVLDPHIGAIYGDSINSKNATEIIERLMAKGFASTNIVFGVGSFTYQYNTRDTFGFAMKATYGEITHLSDDIGEGLRRQVVEPREIFKDPITDDGTKKSKKGLLRVYDGYGKNQGKLMVVDQCSWEDEKGGKLETIFKDSKLIKRTTLEEIRNKLNQYV